MGDSDIVNYLKDLESQSKNLKMELLRACWYMRGGVRCKKHSICHQKNVPYWGNLVKENMETTKKSGQPFF